MKTDLSLWDFALQLYTAPGVSDEAHVLQDHHGADVNILLWTVWMIARGHDPAGVWSDVLHVSQSWQGEVVRPLRAVRRTLKGLEVGVAPQVREAFRQSVAGLELDAERIELDLLERIGLASKKNSQDAEGQVLIKQALLNYGQHLEGPVNFDPFLETVFSSCKMM